MTRNPHQCSFCGSGEHTRRNCEKYRRSRVGARRRCLTCSDLAHRRARPACPECHEPFIPERMPTLADLAEQPREDRRVVPC